MQGCTRKGSAKQETLLLTFRRTAQGCRWTGQGCRWTVQGCRGKGQGCRGTGQGCRWMVQGWSQAWSTLAGALILHHSILINGQMNHPSKSYSLCWKYAPEPSAPPNPFHSNVVPSSLVLRTVNGLPLAVRRLMKCVCVIAVRVLCRRGGVNVRAFWAAQGVNS